MGDGLGRLPQRVEGLGIAVPAGGVLCARGLVEQAADAARLDEAGDDLGARRERRGGAGQRTSEVLADECGDGATARAGAALQRTGLGAGEPDAHRTSAV